MEKAIVILLSWMLLMSVCGKMRLEQVHEQFDAANVQMNQSEEVNAETASTEEAIDIAWCRTYYWAMGSDYIYIGSDGKIYAEGEMEEPLWWPSGACKENYSGEQFTEEELNEFLSLNEDDEDGQKEMLRRKGIRLGK